MKYSKIIIESDGTSVGTKVFIDGKLVEFVRRVELSTDLNETFAHLSIQVARQVKGQIKKHKVKVRDPKTERFVEKEEIETEPLVLERQQS